MIHPSLPKLASFCVYQERSRTEIQEKMQALEIPVEVQPKIWEYLEREEYFNEGRFAAAFVGGKFRQLRWGRKKILYEIQKHRVSGAIIEAAIQSLTKKQK
jgi:regulatory protein